MNERIKTVLSNKEAGVWDYFSLINYFDYSLLRQSKKGASVLSMEFNSVEKTHDGFSFFQNGGDTNFTITNKDITSFSAEILKESNAFHISVELVDSSQITIIVFPTQTSFEITEREQYCEFYFDEFKEYIQEQSNKPFKIRITDVFGMKIEMTGENSVFITENGEEDIVLNVFSTSTSFALPLADDGCNEIYFKSGAVDSILIKPHGQPFMEIVIYMSKLEENNPQLSVVK